MTNVPAGLYYLDLSSWWTNVYGEYDLAIHCGVEIAESFNGTLDHCNYVRLGTLREELMALPSPFNGSIQDDAIYPIGYCHRTEDKHNSFEFGCDATGGVYLTTYDESAGCNLERMVKQKQYYNISGMVYCIYCDYLLFSVHIILV